MPATLRLRITAAALAAAALTALGLGAAHQYAAPQHAVHHVLGDSSDPGMKYRG